MLFHVILWLLLRLRNGNGKNQSYRGQKETRKALGWRSQPPFGYNWSRLNFQDKNITNQLNNISELRLSKLISYFSVELKSPMGDSEFINFSSDKNIGLLNYMFFFFNLGYFLVQQSKYLYKYIKRIYWYFIC